MVAFALGELKCPSLDYVYRMTWAEFQLRLISFNRVQKEELIKLRRLAWVTYIAPHQKPKSLRGKTEQSFWPIDRGDKTPVSNEAKERFIKAYQEYLKKANNGKA